jgi:hypothetical protein
MDWAFWGGDQNFEALRGGWPGGFVLEKELISR